MILKWIPELLENFDGLRNLTIRTPNITYGHLDLDEQAFVNHISKVSHSLQCIIVTSFAIPASHRTWNRLDETWQGKGLLQTGVAEKPLGLAQCDSPDTFFLASCR